MLHRYNFNIPVGNNLSPTGIFSCFFFILFMYNVIKFYKTKTASQ
nr:MAG TPA: hypothetical protein [Caudoviricetes sp.]DAZ64342.1 MAG TPA: hypothetical protein [Caudoviricetes sp.]